MRNEQHLLFHRRHRDQLCLVHRQRDESKVGGAAAISCSNRWDGPVISFTSTSECWRRYSCRRAGNTHADCHVASESKGAVQHLLAVTDDGDGFLDVPEHPMAQLHEGLAGRRNSNLTADGEKDALVQLVLEQQNLPADCRLRHAQLSTGPRERPGLGDRLNHLELAHIDFSR